MFTAREAGRGVLGTGGDRRRAGVMWAIDFQSNPTADGKSVKIASKVDEHTRGPLLDLVERSVTTRFLVAETRAGVRRSRRAADGHGP